VRDAVTAQFVLDQVAKQEEIGVNEGELQQHLIQRAQQSGQNPQEFIQHMLEHNHIPEMVSEVVRGKALASIVEAAVVTDESGNHVELANLQPDGTIADPAAETEDATDGAQAVEGTDEATQPADAQA
jgi:trigger factor